MSGEAGDDPSGPWLKTWGLACVTVVVLFASLELFWRRHGYTPTLPGLERGAVELPARARRGGGP